MQYEPKRNIGLRSGPKQAVQNPRKKETLPPKKSESQTQEKGHNQGHPEKVIEVEEVKKNQQNFNFENELCKIKISMPFTELIKNPGYKNLVLKMMGSTTNQIPSDTVNL